VFEIWFGCGRGFCHILKREGNLRSHFGFFEFRTKKRDLGTIFIALKSSSIKSFYNFFFNPIL
jgi:hypothetical protein